MKLRFSARRTENSERIPILAITIFLVLDASMLILLLVSTWINPTVAQDQPDKHDARLIVIETPNGDKLAVVTPRPSPTPVLGRSVLPLFPINPRVALNQAAIFWPTPIPTPRPYLKEFPQGRLLIITGKYAASERVRQAVDELKLLQLTFPDIVEALGLDLDLDSYIVAAEERDHQKAIESGIAAVNYLKTARTERFALNRINNVNRALTLGITLEQIGWYENVAQGHEGEDPGLHLDCLVGDATVREFNDFFKRRIGGDYPIRYPGDGVIIERLRYIPQSFPFWERLDVRKRYEVENIARFQKIKVDKAGFERYIEAIVTLGQYSQTFRWLTAPSL